MKLGVRGIILLVCLKKKLCRKIGLNYSSGWSGRRVSTNSKELNEKSYDVKIENLIVNYLNYMLYNDFIIHK